MIKHINEVTLVALSFFIQIGSATGESKKSEALTPPPAFSTNCATCLLLDQSVVGPSLVEIATIYRKREYAFIR